MGWISHRKRRETKQVKQQSSMMPGPAVPGCCLVSFCFLCDMHSIHSCMTPPCRRVKSTYVETYEQELFLKNFPKAIDERICR